MKQYRERDYVDGGRGLGDERDPVPHFPYGRPSVSAWVAAAAVAFAVFLLGGFIKTYRELQQLQAESRGEIADLRDALRRVQAQLAVASSQPRGRLPLPSIDAAARQERRAPAAQPPLPSLPDPRTQLRREHPANADESTIAALPSLNDPDDRGIRYQWGRTSGAPASRTLATVSGSPSQVVSVSAANRRVMIEGGRDIALGEGDRLELARDSRWIADLRVQDVFDNQSLCEVLHATHPPLPGDTVRMPEKSM